jgi:hypothetical protein
LSLSPRLTLASQFPTHMVPPIAPRIRFVLSAGAFPDCHGIVHHCVVHIQIPVHDQFRRGQFRRRNGRRVTNGSLQYGGCGVGRRPDVKASEQVRRVEALSPASSPVYVSPRSVVFPATLNCVKPGDHFAPPSTPSSVSCGKQKV